MLVSLCFTSIAQAQSYTLDDIYSRETGNKYHITAAGNGYAQTPLMTYYQLFRTSSAITVDRVGIRTALITGSFAGYPLRFGLMNVNASGYTTTWCGATNDARSLWTPTASAWNEVTLNETASLADNTTYALVIQDYNGTGVLSATRRFQYYYDLTPGAGMEMVRGLNASLESMDCFVTKTSLNVYTFQYNLMGWYIRNFTTSGYDATAYQGQSFATGTARTCYLNYAYNQSFYQWSTQMVDQFSIKVYNPYVTVYRNDSLHVFLYNQTNALIYSGVRNMGTYHPGAAYSWYDYNIDPPIELTLGRYWFKTWTKAPSGARYNIFSMVLADAAGSVHENLTYEGASYFLKTTTNNGTTWTNVKISDLVFKFRVFPRSGLVLDNNSANTTGTLEYAWSPGTGSYGEWWVWINLTGAGAGAVYSFTKNSRVSTYLVLGLCMGVPVGGLILHRRNKKKT